MFSGILSVLNQGGAVAYVLLCVAIALWMAIFLRAMALSSKDGHGVLNRFQAQTEAVGRHREYGAENALRCAQNELGALRSVIRVLVLIAPLLGLLGTVSGMIEMFGSLHSSATGQDSTVASGISTALITTQLGLMISIPGLMASRALHGREQYWHGRLSAEFSSIREERVR